MKNPVAKHASKFNKYAVQVDKKKESKKKKKIKYKGDSNVYSD